jgi:hypothetical protein
MFEALQVFLEVDGHKFTTQLQVYKYIFFCRARLTMTMSSISSDQVCLENARLARDTYMERRKEGKTLLNKK